MRYPLKLALQPSRCILTLLAAIHLLAAAAFVFSPLPFWWQAAASVLLVWSLLGSVRAERRKSGLMLVLNEDGSTGCGAEGALRQARPAPGIADFGWAVWLRLEAPPDAPALPRAGRALMLMPDSLRRADWRGLRIWLRHKAAAAAVSDAGAA